MFEEITSFLFLISRYMHILAAGLLVGGTLFYELVVPVAIDDLKDEQKLFVFARARWAFRWIVWCTAIMLLLSGLVSSYRNWHVYTGFEKAEISAAAEGEAMQTPGRLHLEGPGHWWLGHVVGGLAGLGIAIGLVAGGTPPRYPLVWMRINLLVLLVVIFLASTTRHMRIRVWESYFPPVQGNVE